jgi:hypothetical protein
VFLIIKTWVFEVVDYLNSCGNWDGIVNIATCYGLDGQGIESGGSKIFHSGWFQGPSSLLCSGYRVFHGDKAARV